MREVPLRLDFRAAPEAAVQLLLPLAATLSLHTLLLSAEHASGESLLRSPAISARSGSSLRRLAATAACTDTLRRFPGLQELHLHAGAVEWLYPGGRDGKIPAPTFQPAEGTFQEVQQRCCVHGEMGSTALRCIGAQQMQQLLCRQTPPNTAPRHARSGAARPDQLAAPGPAWLLGG